MLRGPEAPKHVRTRHENVGGAAGDAVEAVVSGVVAKKDDIHAAAPPRLAHHAADNLPRGFLPHALWQGFACEAHALGTRHELKGLS